MAFALVTASELHNQSGLGALIAEARRAGVKPIALTTGLFNEPALRLYRRCGFEEVLRREDAVRMIAKFERYPSEAEFHPSDDIARASHVLGCQQHLCHADDVGLADDDEAQILDAVRQILSDLDLSAAVTVTQDRTSEFNLGPDERDVFIEPVISGPAPIAIHLDGGSIIYFTAGECGTVEWFLDKEVERSRVIEELVAVIEGILRYGLEEHVRAGWWRVGATTFIPTTDGPKKLGYVNSWRKDEIPGTHVIRYPSYVGHSEP